MSQTIRLTITYMSRPRQARRNVDSTCDQNVLTYLRLPIKTMKYAASLQVYKAMQMLSLTSLTLIVDSFSIDFTETHVLKQLMSAVIFSDASSTDVSSARLMKLSRASEDFVESDVLSQIRKMCLAAGREYFETSCFSLIFMTASKSLTLPSGSSYSLVLASSYLFRIAISLKELTQSAFTIELCFTSDERSTIITL